MPADGVVVLYEHPYAYVRNSPVNHSDPSGMQQPGPVPMPEKKPPAFPGAGVCNPAKGNDESFCGANICLLTPLTKPQRLKPIPGVKPPKGGITPIGLSGGQNKRCGLPTTGPIGTGGCGTCICLILKCKNGVAVYHFQAGDDPCFTLGFSFLYGNYIDWSGCEAIICGGDDSYDRIAWPKR